LLSQKKVTKEKTTPSRLFPVLLSFMGGNRKLATLKQPLAKTPIKLSRTGAIAGDLSQKRRAFTIG
jgi:hypothetical protein